MELSLFGRQFSRKTGALALMDDLAYAASSGQIEAMLGGGNPARIASVEAAFERAYAEFAPHFMDHAAAYSGSQGDAAFLRTLADFFNRHYGWDISPAHIALSHGSQQAFFYLFNLFAGEFADGPRKILLPLVPEYLGYADVQVGGPQFAAAWPRIVPCAFQGQSGFFKYHMDEAAVRRLLRDERIGAIACSRPTNPTGNILSDGELATLSQLAAEQGIPLIVDYAYGAPFPNIVQAPLHLDFQAHHILCFSLSKIGLPSLRTGIIVADPSVIASISALNATLGLAPSRMAAGMMQSMLRHDGAGSLWQLAQNDIPNFYQERLGVALDLLRQELADYPLRIHVPEGAFFLWLWFEGLPISAANLYEQLKADGTLVVPGQHYFPGLDVAQTPHAHACVRMSYAQNDASLQHGIRSIGQRVRAAYDALAR